MTTDRLSPPLQDDVARRTAGHAALADGVRLRVVDLLALGDASPTELQARLEVPSNLMAHHLKVLEDAGIAVRRRSQGDRRRSYVTLAPGGLDGIAPPTPAALAATTGLDSARRVVFVCTANSARSQLATALWREASDLPVASAGTHPAAAVARGARAAARRHHLRLVDDTPRHLDEVAGDGDLLVTVCDHAHEDLAGRDAVHWAVPDPVPVGTTAAFDEVVTDLARRVGTLAAATGTLAAATGHPDRRRPTRGAR